MLDGGSYLSEIRQTLPRTSLLLEKIIDGVNQVGISTGVDPTGHISPPDPPQSIQVSAGSDHVHVTLTDSAQRSRALNYFLEWSANDPAFMKPNVEHLGASRGRVMALPAKDGSGDVISYYFRGYSAYLGSEVASDKIYNGPNLNPTPVTLTGASTLNLLTSTGAGTAPTSGEVGGQGFGTDQFA
jgi:hypothetical protein